VHLEPQCIGSQQLGWQVTSAISGEHQMQLQGEAGQNSWQFSAQAEVNQNAELAPLLNMLGWRDQGALGASDLAPGRRLEARGGGRF